MTRAYLCACSGSDAENPFSKQLLMVSPRLDIPSVLMRLTQTSIASRLDLCEHQQPPLPSQPPQEIP